MKNFRKWIVVCLTAAIVLSLAACGADKAPVSQEEAGRRIEELIQKEQEVMDANKELWDKVRENAQIVPEEETTDGLTGAEIAKNNLLRMIEDAKAVLTEEEITMLKKDADKIYELEKELDVLFGQTDTAAGSEAGTTLSSLTRFPEFQTKDLNGNDVDHSIFSQYAVTVMNFWYNECSPCIGEIPLLNDLNNELKEKGGLVLGVNLDGSSGEEGIKAAREILETLNADYQNVYFASGTEAGSLAETIQAFPTTILLDRDGNVIGSPIVGSVEGDETMQELRERIEEILQQDAAR